MAAKNRTAFISQRPPHPFPSFPRFLSPFGSRTSIHHHWVVEVWRRWHRHLPRLLTNVANPGAEPNIAGWKNPTILRKHGGIIHGVFFESFPEGIIYTGTCGFRICWGLRGRLWLLGKLCGWIEHEFRKRTCYKVCYQRDHIDNVDCELEKTKKLPRTVRDFWGCSAWIFLDVGDNDGQAMSMCSKDSPDSHSVRENIAHMVWKTHLKETPETRKCAKLNIVLYLDQVGDWLQ